jgi:hypothetical protein
MNPQIFTERLRGLIAGYFLTMTFSLLMISLHTIMVAPKYGWLAVAHDACYVGLTICAGLIACGIFFKKPLAPFLGTVFAIAIAVLFLLGGTGLGQYWHSAKIAMNYFAEHIFSLMMIAALIWLWKRDHKNTPASPGICK